jgi:hypothetical protein
MLKIEAISEDPAGNELVRVKDKWYPREEIEEQIEREQSRRFMLRTLLGIGLCIAALAYSLAANAAQYKPTTEEALLIRPERPVERIQSSVPCLRPAERPKRVLWVLRDKDGNVLIAGSQIVRARC